MSPSQALPPWQVAIIRLGGSGGLWEKECWGVQATGLYTARGSHSSRDRAVFSELQRKIPVWKETVLELG